DHKCETRCKLGATGGEPLAIRALKRFVTDTVDPSAYRPAKAVATVRDCAKVAVVGAGPAGLAAAHYLSLAGCKVTVLEAEQEPGGMLMSCIPDYRLPGEVVRKEIKSLLNEDIALKCGVALGRDITLDGIFEDGFKAVFLAMGANESLKLNIEGEDTEGIYPSMRFLKGFNLKGEKPAAGHVGVIGGGNSAVDAARVALRQEGVKSVTIFYRRTRREMPAYEEEIDAALEEGVKLETLVSPVKIHSKDGRLVGARCVKNKLGDFDSSGRRSPVPLAGSEFDVPLDTLIVAVGEQPASGFLKEAGLKLHKNGRLCVDEATLCTNRQGVFAGGDIVTGPNTVVDAIAAGKKAAELIRRHLNGEDLEIAAGTKLPEFYIEPAKISDKELAEAKRVRPRALPAEERKKSFAEAERALSAKDAGREARRCLRCDLKFTQKEEVESGRNGGAVCRH
ncbi:MAG: FAD-dependent oxidoreductase, partial [Pseudomonadota bacterium]